MTAVMQLTDVAVAFSLKKLIEATKAEVRREKRGELDVEMAFRTAGVEAKKFGASDLLTVLGRAWDRMKYQDEVQEPDRLLKAARACGWLSYRADPMRKTLIRCDEEDWMRGLEDDFPEKSHRHPSDWWDARCKWLDEKGEPRQADSKGAGGST